MRAIVTCGPASAPIDHVRKITNFATGEIGAVLSSALHRAGHEVTCFRGQGATHPAPQVGEVRTFSTNDSLLEGLRSLANSADVIFHAAALADFEVHAMEADGRPIPKAEGKISSSAQSVLLHLAPAPKILPQLRALFPEARIVGWKFEVGGNRESALIRGRDQILSCKSDACVVNGAAYGPGFGFLTAHEGPQHCESKQELAEFCVKWLL